MKPEEFEKKMEDLNKPLADAVKAPVEIKLAIVNAQRSARLGIWFVVIPYFFIACMLLKYELDVNLGLLNAFDRLVHKIDNNPLLWWIQPVILIGLPIAGIILNTLAITHFRWDTATRSLLITVKMRWVNLVILVISLLIISAFGFYLVVENFQARA